MLKRATLSAKRIVVTRRCDRGVTWHVVCHQTATFMGFLSCESEDKIFWFVTWPHNCSFTWLCGWSPLILRHHFANFGVHMPYGTGNDGDCNVSFNSNSKSNSNAEDPKPEASTGGVLSSVKKGVLRNYAKLLKSPATLLKKRLRQRCFPVNFAKFQKAPFLQNSSRRLLLQCRGLQMVIIFGW